MGDIACSEGDYLAGEKYFLESLEIARFLNDRFNQAIVLNNLATVYHSAHNYTQEQALLEESLLLCREIGDRDGEAVALNNLGEMSAARADYASAVTYSLQALEIARQVGEEWTLIICLDSLGEAYSGLRDVSAARSCLLQALQLAVEIQSPDMLARVAVHYGHLSQLRGRLDLAIRLYQAALAHPATEEDYAAQARAWLGEIGVRAETSPDERLLEAAVAQVLAEG